MCKTIAIINQKGGCGKTTTAIHLGIGLARRGKRVLLDPQASMTVALGNKAPDQLHHINQYQQFMQERTH